MRQYIWQHKNWPHFHWDAETVLARLSQCNLKRGQLQGRVASLGLRHSLEAQAEILSAEVLETSSIEGHRLAEASVRSSVARKLGVPEAGLTRRDRYTDGLVDVLLDATTHYQQALTIERLHGWQAALFPSGFSGMHPVAVGQFRDDSPMQVVSGPFGHESVHYEAPPGHSVAAHMDQFLRWWQQKKQIDGVIRAALAGFWFVTIHPYEDGNGRLARAITDMALAQDEKLSLRYYSFSAQIMQEREAYYAILEKSQKGDLDLSEWLLWFLDCFQRAIEHSGELLDKVLTKARFWEIHSQAELNQRQRKVINLLLDAGRGGFIGGMTTRKYVSLNKTSRATAYREISDLCDKKVLQQNQGKGRNVSYDLIWPE